MGLTLREYAVFAVIALVYVFAVLVVLRRLKVADTDRILLLILICTLPVLGSILAILFTYARKPFSSANNLMWRDNHQFREEQS